MAEFGIMQGRVLPGSVEKLQVFPEHWQEEFIQIRKLGFAVVELLDDKMGKLKSLLSTGRQDVLRALSEADLQASSICMDRLCDHSWTENSAEFIAEIREFVELWAQPAIYVIPFFDRNIVDSKQLPALLADLAKLQPLLEQNSAQLALELDFAAEEIADLDYAPSLGVCYDLGNREQAGEDIKRALPLLRNILLHVHIKHRVNGENIRLEKTALLRDAFNELRDYRGNFILETCIKPEPLEEARHNLALVLSVAESQQ